jgi:ketosteroid isomerase-like protein
MSQANVELVRKAFDALRLSGVEAMLAFYTSDVVVYTRADWADDTEARGHDGARRLYAMFTHPFDDFAWEVQEIRAVEDRVVVLAQMEGRIKGSGVPIRERQGILFSDFRDGMCGEVRFFTTWEQALEAMGPAG